MSSERLFDIYTKKVCRVWCMFVLDGDDFHLELCRDKGMTEAVGESPEWFEEDAGDWKYHVVGIRDIRNEHGIYESFAWMQWALEHGIAPYQPFLFEVGEPRWYQSSWEYNEWDSEQDMGLERVLPWPQWKAMKNWEKFLAYRERFIKGKNEYFLKLWALQKSEVQHMYLAQDWYYPHGCYDDYSPPTGLILNLCTMRTRLEKVDKRDRATLATGRSDKGKFDESMQSLIERCAETLPHLTEEQIRALPVRHRF